MRNETLLDKIIITTVYLVIVAFVAGFIPFTVSFFQHSEKLEHDWDVLRTFSHIEKAERIVAEQNLINQGN